MARVSFVVPAWNEARLLPGTLGAIHAAARAGALDYQVVVADDASTDGTAEVARAHGAEVVRCEHRQIAATRNAGARASDGDFLIFVDADTRVTPAAVRAAVAALRDGATYGGADVDWDTELPLWSVLMLRAVLAFFRWNRLAVGAFLFCTRAAYERAGGFDESLYAAEEYYFSRALRRFGRHAWVTDRVVTSGRKLRTHSVWEIGRHLGRLAFRGPRALRSRRALGIWYEERREDPVQAP